jgi:PGF-pre-PGF domain-containing protein/PGF-CTERM protein
MNGYNPALGITASIYDQPGDTANTAFVLAAQDENLEIVGIAYAVYFTKTNLTGNDTIYDAVLRLTVSENWVNANGGVDAVRVFRLGDDGTREVLNTAYEGMENGMMVFSAVSPKGFSAFALGAVTTSTPQTPSPSGSRGGGGGGSRASVGAASNLKLGDRITLTMQGTAITAVTITANDDLKEVMVTVAKGSLPQDASSPEGTVYQYIETALYRAAASDLSTFLIQFMVPTAWLAEQGCTISQVGLFRYTAEGWKEIPVETLGEENGNAIFSASADAFGLFAIAVTGEAPDVVTEPPLVPIETVITHPTDMTTPTAEPTQTPGFGALVTLAGLGAVTLLALRRR